MNTLNDGMAWGSFAAIGDAAHPSWRASSVGVYRLGRDLGYALGAVIADVVADSLGLGLGASVWTIAALTFVSRTAVVLRMGGTHRRVDARDLPQRTGKRGIFRPPHCR